MLTNEQVADLITKIHDAIALYNSMYDADARLIKLCSGGQVIDFAIIGNDWANLKGIETLNADLHTLAATVAPLPWSPERE